MPGRFSKAVDLCSAVIGRADSTATRPPGCLPRETIAGSWRAAGFQAADGATVITGALPAGVVRPHDGGAATLTGEGAGKTWKTRWNVVSVLRSAS